MATCQQCDSEIVGIIDDVEARIGGSAIDSHLEHAKKLGEASHAILTSQSEKSITLKAQVVMCPECKDGDIILMENIPFALAFHDEKSEISKQVEKLRENLRSVE